MIKPPIDSLVEGTPTIFIKTDKASRAPQKSWEGYVDGFKPVMRGNEPSIAFKVHLKREIPIPAAYRNYGAGWYLVGEQASQVSSMNQLEAHFFTTLQSITNKDEFETLTFELLKLLGIHEIFRYSPEDQAGRADGFFQFEHVSVLYDCTLRYPFESKKDDQVGNFIRQLESGSIKYEMWDYDVFDTYNYVWIVTKGTSRTLRVTRSVTAKEVPISKLIDLYSQRILENLNTRDFESALRAI